MPYYDYQCNKCENVQEEVRSMTETKKVKCRACKSENMSIIISGGTGAIFKGSGFYQTDYKEQT